MSFATIARELINHIDDLALSPAIPIVKPEQPYKPVVGREYLELVFAPNETLTVFVGDDDPQQQQGFLQVTVVYPRNSGTEAPLLIADAVVNHYRKGTVLRGEDGTSVRVIRKPWVSMPFQDEGWFRVPVTVPYLCIG